MPSTPAEVERAYVSYPFPNKTTNKDWRKQNGLPGSFQVGDRTYTHKTKILAPVQKGCKCVHFVAESVGPGVTSRGDREAGSRMEIRPLPERLAAKPFEATSLCNGGRMWTGTRSFATKAEADRAVAARAEYERSRCGKGGFIPWRTGRTKATGPAARRERA